MDIDQCSKLHIFFIIWSDLSKSR